MYDVVIQQRRKPLPTLDCPVCGRSFRARWRSQETCSNPCAAARRSEKARARNSAKKRILDRGRWYIKVDGRWVAEHRHIYEKTYGVKLKSYHYVEWANGDRNDNRPENLRIRNPYIDAYVKKYGRLPKTADRDGRICPEHKTRWEVVSRSQETNTPTYGCKKCNAERLVARRAKTREAAA